MRVALALALGGARAHAMGLAEIASNDPEGEITVFYPTPATATCIERGRGLSFDTVWQGVPARGNG